MSLPWIQVDCYPKQETVVAGVVMATARLFQHPVTLRQVPPIGASLQVE